MAKVNGVLVVMVVVALMAVALSVVSASDEAPRQYGDGTKLWGIVDQTSPKSGDKFAFDKDNHEQPELTLEVAGDNVDWFGSYSDEAQPQNSLFGSTLMSGYEAGEQQAQWLQKYWNTWIWGR